MKCLLVFALLCAVAYCQMGNGGMGSMCIERLARDQVSVMVAEDPSLTVAECEARCDALFLFDSVPADETRSDTACADQCQANISA